MALQIIRNNIINVEADAIVNTANPAAGVGRGVDHSIYEAAGWDRLLEARREIGEMSPGEAAWTPAFDLHAKYIIHTVGPAWRGGSFAISGGSSARNFRNAPIARRTGFGS